MTRKEVIFNRIKAYTHRTYPWPEMSFKPIRFEEKIISFAKTVQAAGGDCLVAQESTDINELIRNHYPQTTRIASILPEISYATFDSDKATAPRELNGTDVAVLRGTFGMIENGAV